MSKRNSIKGEPAQPITDRKVSATIDDLYWLDIGRPPVRHWFLDFSYTLPRSPHMVNHDYETIQSDTLPPPTEWADRIVSRFDCVSRDSIVRGLSQWIAKHNRTI